MVLIPNELKNELGNWVYEWQQRYARGQYAVIVNNRPHLHTDKALKRIFEDSNELIKVLQEPISDVPNRLLPCLKAAVEREARETREYVEKASLSSQTASSFDALQASLTPTKNILNSEWMQSVEALRFPKMTDYVSIQEIESKLFPESNRPSRVYDDKFGILQAASHFWIDMEYYRRVCAYRGIGITVAFADLDGFKPLNSRLTETVVDRMVLPHVMRALEAHCFNRGFSYRFGGDEYVILLPNVSYSDTVMFLETLRRRIADTRFPTIEERTTASIGFVTIDAEELITNRQTLEAANMAATFAKKSGKNCIATYSDRRFIEEVLTIVDTTWVPSW